MRSITTQFAKVEGHDSFVRDMSSHAIISTSNDEYHAYKRRSEAAKRNANIILEQTNQIQSLKSEVEEIKEMLIQILKGK